LKYQSDAVNDSRTRRSRFRTENNRRKSRRPSRNAAQKASQMGVLLIFLPPNAPS